MKFVFSYYCCISLLDVVKNKFFHFHSYEGHHNSNTLQIRTHIRTDKTQLPLNQTTQTHTDTDRQTNRHTDTEWQTNRQTDTEGHKRTVK